MPKKRKMLLYFLEHVIQADQDESPDYSKLSHETPSMPNSRDLTKSSSMKLCKKKVKI